MNESRLSIYDPGLPVRGGTNHLCSELSMVLVPDSDSQALLGALHGPALPPRFINSLLSLVQPSNQGWTLLPLPTTQTHDLGYGPWPTPSGTKPWDTDLVSPVGIYSTVGGYKNSNSSQVKKEVHFEMLWKLGSTVTSDVLRRTGCLLSLGSQIKNRTTVVRF